MQDKIKGGVFGLAVGDALGATVEFMPAAEIKKKYGRHSEMIGGGWLALAPGEFTDDTEMMLAVAEGLAASPLDPVPAIGQGFMAWYQTNPKDIGNIIRLALGHFQHCQDWQLAAAKTRTQLDGRVAGNGCLMRTLPVTFAYLGDPQKMTSWSRAIAAMTHQDGEAEMACAFYNRYAHRLLFSQDKKASLRILLAEMKELFLSSGTEKLFQILSAVPSQGMDQVQATGYVVDTLVAALVSFLTEATFEDVLVAAVNLGDDADTVGAVAGGLAGVYYGYQSIPRRWLEKLSGQDRLGSSVQGLIAIHD